MDQVVISGRTEEEAINRLIVLLKGLPAGAFEPAENFIVYKEGMYFLAEVKMANHSRPEDYNIEGCYMLCMRLCSDARLQAERGNKRAISFLKNGWISKSIGIDGSALERSLREW